MKQKLTFKESWQGWKTWEKVFFFIIIGFLLFILAYNVPRCFAETVDFGNTPAYVVCVSADYGNENGDAKYCCISPIICCYKNNQSELILCDANPNNFVGIWYSENSYNTSAAGAFVSHTSVYGDNYYYFSIGYIGNASFSSNYPYFDNEEYALRYVGGDSSVLPYATNYNDLVSDDSRLNEAVKNYYFSNIGNNYATFILETNSISTESYRIFARVTTVSCSVFSPTAFNSGLRANGLNDEGWALISNNGSVLSTSNIVLDPPSITSPFDSGWYGLAVGTPLTSQHGTLFISESDLLGNTVNPAYYYQGGLHPRSVPECGALCQYFVDDWVEVGSVAPGATFTKSFNMHQFSSANVTGLPNGFSVNSNMPLCYQVEFYIVTNDNRKSDTHVLLSSIDGSLTNGSGNGVTSNQGQTVIGGNGQSSTSFVDSSGNVVGQYGDLALDNSNIIEFVKNGMGLTGPNGMISVYQSVLSFFPSEIWALIFAVLALSIVLMIIKVLRGMG